MFEDFLNSFKDYQGRNQMVCLDYLDLGIWDLEIFVQ